MIAAAGRTLTRRGLLGAACCCVGAAALGARCEAATSDVAAIDVHHHVIPPAWINGARKEIEATNRNTAKITDWTPARSLEDMDANGVRKSMASITNPGTWFGDAAKAMALGRACNEYIADLKRDRPDRFGGLATLPLPDADASLEEIRYALDVLKLDGFGLMTSYDDKWLGDARFAPVLAELDRRKAAVFVHPTASVCCMAPIPDVSPSVIEFPLDTTRTIVSLLFSGALHRYPSINWIFSHAGGTLPMLAQRIANIIGSQPRLRERAPNGAMHELRKLNYDLAQGASPMQLAALTRLVPTSQIVFGSDFPFVSAREAREGMASWEFDAATRDAISRDNARRLFSMAD